MASRFKGNLEKLPLGRTSAQKYLLICSVIKDDGNECSRARQSLLSQNTLQSHKIRTASPANTVPASDKKASGRHNPSKQLWQEIGTKDSAVKVTANCSSSAQWILYNFGDVVLQPRTEQPLFNSPSLSCNTHRCLSAWYLVTEGWTAGTHKQLFLRDCPAVQTNGVHTHTHLYLYIYIYMGQAPGQLLVSCKCTL